eukprot:scaffold3156_cov268-Chaetoceros_neogracile.AAC.43
MDCVVSDGSGVAGKKTISPASPSIDQPTQQATWVRYECSSSPFEQMICINCYNERKKQIYAMEAGVTAK